MTYKSKIIIGYEQDGIPVYRPTGVGTCAFISCCKCRNLLSGMGGPRDGIYCPECSKEEGII